MRGRDSDDEGADSFGEDDDNYSSEDAGNVEPSLDDLLKDEGFTFRHDLKNGVSGMVALFVYTGENAKNENVKNLRKHDVVLVKISLAGDPGDDETDEMKHARLTSENEVSIVRSLQDKRSSTRPNVCALQIGGHTCVVNEPLFYHDEKFKANWPRLIAEFAKNQEQIASKKSEIADEMQHIEEEKSKLADTLNAEIASLERKVDQVFDAAPDPGAEHVQNEINNLLARKAIFMERLRGIAATENNPRLESLRDEQDKLIATASDIDSQLNQLVRGGFKNLVEYADELGANTRKDPADIFERIFSDIAKAQAELHRNRIIHLDTSCRNVFLNSDGSFCLGDFGASQLIDSDGHSVKNEKFPIVPVESYNQDAVQRNGKHKYSIATDQFSLKTTMIEILARYCGEDDIRKVLCACFNVSRDQLGYKFINRELPKYSDEDRLKASLQYLRNVAEQLKVSKDPRGEFALAAIKKYEPYILSQPKLHASVEDQVKANLDALGACLNSVAREKVEQRHSSTAVMLQAMPAQPSTQHEYGKQANTGPVQAQDVHVQEVSKEKTSNLAINADTVSTSNQSEPPVSPRLK